MKHKNLALFILTIVLVLSLSVLGACSLFDTPSREHEDTFATDWTYDENSHWHAATCEHYYKVNDKNNHIFTDGICSVCEYVEGAPPHSHTYSDEWTSDESCHWHVTTCGHTSVISEKEDHTCDIKGNCSVCGYHIHIFANQWTSNSTNHWHAATCEHRTEIDVAKHTFVDGVCSVCGQIQTDETYQSSDGFVWSENGNYIYFGEYPQSAVTNNAIVAMLNWEASPLPTKDNSQDWTDYGYYILNEAQSYTWYIDIVSNGVKYRGVYFTLYRPLETNSHPDYYSSSQLCQYNNGYNTYTVYWFKYEPIRWRVLSQADETAFLMCDSIIDSQAYQNSIYFQDDGLYTHSNNAPEGTYASNYQYSTIRSWLNDDFYNTAFSTLAQQLILTTEVDNGILANNWDDEKYTCDNTYDKIFLLSYNDVVNSDYGFGIGYSDGWLYPDTYRCLKTTAYAQSQGALTVTEENITKNNGHWLLRSPSAYLSEGQYYPINGGQYIIYAVGESGLIYPHGWFVNNTHIGVVPALQIQL